MYRLFISAATVAASVPFSPALAQQIAPTDTVPQVRPQTQPSGPPHRLNSNIVITGRRLDIARDAITPSLGASQYTFDQEALEKQPGGTNLTLNKSLLQAPGRRPGQLRRDPRPQRARQPAISPERRHRARKHQRLRHDLRSAGSQARSSSSPAPCRRNMATAPRASSISRPSRACSTMAARSAIYGGSFGWLEPSAMIQGSTGDFSYFLSGSYLRNDLGIENPTADAQRDPRPNDAVPAVRLRVRYPVGHEPHRRCSAEASSAISRSRT